MVTLVQLEARLRVLENAEAERQGVVKFLRLAQTIIAIGMALLTGYLLLRGGS